MHCRSCGGQLTGTPAFCPNCGALPYAGNAFCSSCGSPTDPLAEVCLPCGARLAHLSPEVSSKSRVVAALLAYFLGVFGVHRFYAGRVLSGVAMIALSVVAPAVGFGAFVAAMFVGSDIAWWGFVFLFLGYGGLIAVSVWWTIDFVVIVVGKFRDGQGRYVRSG